MRPNAGRGVATILVVLATGSMLACGPSASPDRGTDASEGTSNPTGEAPVATPDARRDAPPGSLRAIMIGLEEDMAGIAHGIWWSDFEAIATSATAIAEHPKIPPEGRAAIAGALGEEMSAFAGLDREVHDAAVRVREAADAGDLDAALAEWQAIQDGCVACHRTFRERLRPVLAGTGSSGSDAP